MGISKTTLVVATVAVTAVLVAGLATVSLDLFRTAGRTFWGDTETTITLRQPGGGACTITGKETEVIVKRNQKITWKVVNYCATAQTVSIGNFRSVTAAGAKTGCTDATDGGTTWPFKGPEVIADRQVTVDPAGDEEIEQKAKDLGSSPVEFNFDICVGAGAGVKFDPRLVLDP